MPQIALKQSLPECEVGPLALQRPKLLLPEHQATVQQAAQDLRSIFQDEKKLAVMVTAQPTLLLQDVQALVQDLERLVPGHDVPALLREKRMGTLLHQAMAMQTHDELKNSQAFVLLAQTANLS